MSITWTNILNDLLNLVQKDGLIEIYVICYDTNKYI